MKVTFLGHGLNSDNKYNVGKQLANSFESTDFSSFYGFVAFAASTGIEKILQKIKTAQSNFDTLRFYIGVDNRGTSKESLELLLKEEIETYIYHHSQEYITFHPKLFLFEGIRFSRVIIGSSNLTSSGFRSNIEASVQIDFRTKTDTQGIKLIKEIKETYKYLINLSDKNTFKLDRELIDKYDNLNFLYHQLKGKNTETKPNDGENKEEKSTPIEIPKIDFDDGFSPKNRKSSKRKNNVTQYDYDIFDEMLEKYKIYKKNIRQSGVVDKNTEERELLYWYKKMKRLIKHNTLPDIFFDRLMEVGFPIEDGWNKRRMVIWNQRFNEVVAYKLKYNPESKTTHIPQLRDSSNPYSTIGTWCATQKQRRKGNTNPEWTEYEENKMNSINFLWEVPDIGGGKFDNEGWYEKLLELESYYQKKENFKTIPHQKTKIGKWVNTQMTLKITGSRGSKKKKYLNPLREELLGELFSKNGIEWEWKKQKQRETIEELAKDWVEFKEKYGNRKLTSLERKQNDELKKRINQARYRSKKWEDWKRQILLDVGFDLPEKIN